MDNGLQERWVVESVKERKGKWAVPATLVNGLCFLGRGRNFAESYGLSVMKDPDSTGMGFDSNLEPTAQQQRRLDCQVCRIGLGVV